jgi:magnesium-protoporphyrin O-methyltransferase
MLIRRKPVCAPLDQGGGAAAPGQSARPSSGGYLATRAKLTDYFDEHASETWERLTSDAPVSRIRATVRAGRDAMRAKLLAALPLDLTGARVLDAGCGAGQMAVELARRGADVVAVDVAPSLLDVARRRMPEDLAGHVMYIADDMTDARLGRFDHVVAMDSLIHYDAPDIAAALDGLARRTARSIVFTVAPATPLLTAMWWAGQAFPSADRSPAIRPHATPRLAAALGRPLHDLGRVHRGFYVSQALEIAP